MRGKPGGPRISCYRAGALKLPASSNNSSQNYYFAKFCIHIIGSVWFQTYRWCKFDTVQWIVKGSRQIGPQTVGPRGSTLRPKKWTVGPIVRGPTVWGPIVHPQKVDRWAPGPIVRGPTVWGPICLEPPQERPGGVLSSDFVHLLLGRIGASLPYPRSTTSLCKLAMLKLKHWFKDLFIH